MYRVLGVYVNSRNGSGVVELLAVEVASAEISRDAGTMVPNGRERSSLVEDMCQNGTTTLRYS